MSDVWKFSNGCAWQCYIFTVAYYMHGDDGGLDYLEIIARSLGGDVDNEDGVCSDDEDDDDESDDDADDDRSKKKSNADKAHPPRQYKTMMARKGDNNKREGGDLAAKVGSYLEAMTPARQPPTTKEQPGDGMIMKRLELEMARDDKMDDRFSAMLTNPNCPAALVESMTAHFMKQLEARSK